MFNLSLLIQGVGNTGLSNLKWLLLLISLYFLFINIDKFLEKYIKNTKLFLNNGLRKTILKILCITDSLFYICLSGFIVLNYSGLNQTYSWLNVILFGVLLVFGARIVQKLLIFSLAFYFEKKSGQNNLSDIDLIRNLGVFPLVIRIVVWVASIIIFLDFLNFDISNLIATLGISSLIIAFALQNVLQDLFASLSVFLDKPFEVGDFIKTEKEEGTVLKVGIKSTRIRSKTGEIIVIPNKLLSEGRVRNFRELQVRKNFAIISFKPSSNLKNISLFLSEIASYLKTVQNLKLERVTLKNIGFGRIEVEIVYFYHSDDYQVYCQALTEINLECLKTAEKLQLDLYEGSIIENFVRK
jgi:small-conductance mechanosensitive channel